MTDGGYRVGTPGRWERYRFERLDEREIWGRWLPIK
jgi:hypothetical protein